MLEELEVYEYAAKGQLNSIDCHLNELSILYKNRDEYKNDSYLVKEAIEKSIKYHEEEIQRADVCFEQISNVIHEMKKNFI